VATGISIPLLSWVVGVGFGVLTVVRAIALSQALGRRTGWALPLAIGTAPAFLYWWFSGLETSMVTWLAIEMTLAAVRIADAERSPHWLLLAGATGAFLAVRPESFAILICAQLAWLAIARPLHRDSSGQAWKRMAGWLALTAALQVALFLWRQAYFGDWFPQPVAAKVGTGLAQNVLSGLHYYSRLITRPWCLLLLPILMSLPFWLWSALRSGRPVAKPLFGLLFLGAQASFILFSGGDWMFGERFFAHMFPLAIVMAEEALASRFAPSIRRLSSSTRRIFATSLIALQLFIVVLLGYVGMSAPLWPGTETVKLPSSRSIPELYSGPEWRNRVHLRDILTTPELIETTLRISNAKREKVLLLSGQAGMLAYELARALPGQFRFIDLYGLTSRKLTSGFGGLEIARGPRGLSLGYSRYFALAAQHPDAELLPDIIFDVNPGAIQTLKARGYEIVYLQQGDLPAPTLDLGIYRVGKSLAATQFIAVEQSWAHLFPDRLRVYSIGRDQMIPAARLPAGIRAPGTP